MDVKSVTVKSSCIQCGTPIEVKSIVYKGKEILKQGLFKTGQFHLNDPYALVHLLCDKCDMKQGFQTSLDTEDEENQKRIRKFVEK